MISKIIKVSDKGQISIPIEVRRNVGIKRNDSLMLMQLDNRIIIEKPENLVKDNFSDLNSDTVAKRLWDNKYDEIWNNV